MSNTSVQIHARTMDLLREVRSLERLAGLRGTTDSVMSESLRRYRQRLRRRLKLGGWSRQQMKLAVAADSTRRSAAARRAQARARLSASVPPPAVDD